MLAAKSDDPSSVPGTHIGVASFLASDSQEGLVLGLDFFLLDGMWEKKLESNFLY